MRTKLSTWRGWLFAIFAAVMLTACDPVADIIAPEQAEAGQPVQFKAQLFEEFQNEDQQGIEYAWDFGDGGAARGPQAQHAYAQAGEYEVTLRVTDPTARQFGQAYISKARIRIVAAGQTAPFKVTVVGQHGQGVAAAKVVVAGQEAVTNGLGVAEWAQVPTGVPVVVQVRAAGHVPQSLVVPSHSGTAQERTTRIQLKALAPAIDITDIAAAGTYAGESLNARMTISASAFVKPDGQRASGPVKVAITPWDITRPEDMDAFPGARMARAADGGTVRLISFGMINVHVEQDGQKLQLAPGQTAEIAMDLPVDHDEKGEPLAVGQKIPLWHFDETQGLWLQEGEGEVVASETAWTGLGVRARVSHFSSWNWDRIQDPSLTPLSARVSCQVPQGNAYVDMPVGKTCLVHVRQTLANGMVLTDDVSVTAGGLLFDRFVPGAAVELSARSHGLLRRGEASVAAMSASITAIPIQLSEEIVVVDNGGVPVIDEAYVPFEILPTAGQYEDVDRAHVTVTKDGVPAALAGWPRLADEIGYTSAGAYVYALTGQGNAGGAFGPGNLSGRVVVQVPILGQVFNPATNNYDFAVIRTETRALDIPRVSYQGMTLVRDASAEPEAQEWFSLWREVGVTKAIDGDAVVSLRFSTYVGEEVSWTGEWRNAPVSSDGRFSLHLSQCSDLPSGTRMTSLEIRVTRPGSSVEETFTTRPFPVRYASCT